jgi:simple sugar transport system substrate-binding protein
MDISNDTNLKKVNWWKITAILSISLVFISLFVFSYYVFKKPVSKTVAEEKICSGVNIVFFAGGGENDSFASVVAGGAKAAEADLGPKVKYMWSDWNSNTMVSQFIDAISMSPDAIAIMGHPGAKVLSPLIDEAERKNIIVTAQNVDLPEIRAKYSSNGFGYVGQSVYDSGLLVSSAVIRKYNVQEGTEAIVFGVNPVLNPSRYERTKGEVDGLKNAKVNVHEVAMPLEVEKDASSLAAQTMIADALAAFPNAKVIITDHGQLTASIAAHLKNLNKKPGEFIVAGFDLSAGTVAGIQDGYIGLILDQQPYLQGYLPVLQACLSKKYGFSGLYVNTGMGLIDISNVDLVANLAKEKIR